MGKPRKKRILLVDDDSAFRESFRELLESKGYEVTEAADGLEAESHLESTEFDLTITDILMPDRDGLELIKIMRKLRPSMKFIAISGGGLIEADKYLLLAGNYPMVSAKATKPFNIDEMLETISRLIG